MDKNTLSNYGWIVIAVLVLSVMIALATPFGKYIENGVRSTTAGLFDTSEKALNVVGMSAGDGSFESGSGESSEQETVVGSATFEGYFDKTELDWNWIDDVTTLTLDELKLAENGAKYSYNASAISVTSIGDMAFSYCDTLTSITIPDSVTSIGYYAFGFCPRLTSVTIPDSVTSIGNDAFAECTLLTSITIPDSVTSIGNGVFNACSSLTSITIPDSVTNIGQCAFTFCTQLTNINFAGTKAQWNQISLGTEWNYGCSEITVTCTDGIIIIPEGPAF